MLTSSTRGILRLDSRLGPLSVYVDSPGHRPQTGVFAKNDSPGQDPVGRVITVLSLSTIERAILPHPSLDRLPNFDRNQVRYRLIEVDYLTLIGYPSVVLRGVPFDITGG